MESSTLLRMMLGAWRNSCLSHTFPKMDSWTLSHLRDHVVKLLPMETVPFLKWDFFDVQAHPQDKQLL
jgi:hypothetical protein